MARAFRKPALIACACIAAAAAGAHELHRHDGEALGVVRFPVSCSADAQRAFDRAIALLHHMTYPQARTAFEHAAAADPRCAMAHWGVAMTLFQPLWPTRPGPADLRRGFDEARLAAELAPPTERERLFIAAAAAFFEDPAGKDYWLRIRRWADAAAAMHDALPDDPEATAFHALALLATMPANAIVREPADRAAAMLIRVYEENPEHPGAMHYLVHANDVPGRERELLEVTRKYERVAPRNPHALHMPTHIYTRLGDWDGVVRGNRLAAEAALEHPAGDHGQYVWDEFPHAIEYLVYAHLQKGEFDESAAEIARLHATGRIEPTFKTAFHFASTRARHALERHAWDEASRIEARQPAWLDWDRFWWPEAIGWFARGLGAARLGRLDESGAAIRRLGELEGAARLAGEELFARNIRVLALELRAWQAHAEGAGEAALQWMREAAELETATPKHAVTPAPTIPAHEQLGDLLMEMRRPAEALASYRRSLELYPNRRNGQRGVAAAGSP